MLRYLLLSISILILCGRPASSDIGKITEEKGSASVVRKSSEIDAKMNVGIDSMDTVKTGKGVIGITFVDNTQVRVTENSKLLIDDFVYDPKSNNGKLDIKVALGTVRYASGQIAHNNAQNVNIKTPTASIGVRGTAFSMTVDEIGRSLVILLPNPDGTVGSISVETDAGFVLLTKAFQATMTSSSEQKPSPATLLNLSESMIDNLLIVKPPAEIIEKLREENTGKSLLDKTDLDDKPLDVNVFEDKNVNYDELSINILDTDLLSNSLDTTIMNKLVAGYYSSAQVYMFDSSSGFRITRNVEHDATMIVNKDQQYDIQIKQGGDTVQIKTSDDASNKIRITQTK
jgi:FecR protein